MQRQRRKLILVLIISGLLLAGSLAGLGFWLGWFSPAPAPRLAVGLPGASVGDAAEFKLESDEANLLQERMLKLLDPDLTGGLASWYRLAGRLGKPEAARSDTCLAADQLRYGQFLLESGDKTGFQEWWDAFRTAYLNAQGLIRSQAGLADNAVMTAADFWRDNLAALRLIAQSCTLWPDEQRYLDLETLSSQLLDYAKNNLPPDFSALVPTSAPILDPAATPTPKPTASPAATPTGSPEQILPVLRLASVDLYAIQQLAALDGGWQTLYDQYLSLVQGGYISDDLPLYALAYSESQDGYLSYNGDSPSVNTEEALLTLLHLCEVGGENPRSLNWLRDQLYNRKAIYESYHIAQGQATSEQECITGYAVVARIARIEGDLELYQAAVQRLLWHQATNLKSDALDAVFREDADGQIRVLAADNTWALLALR